MIVEWSRSTTLSVGGAVLLYWGGSGRGPSVVTLVEGVLVKWAFVFTLVVVLKCSVLCGRGKGLGFGGMWIGGMWNGGGLGTGGP